MSTQNNEKMDIFRKNVEARKNTADGTEIVVGTIASEAAFRELGIVVDLKSEDLNPLNNDNIIFNTGLHLFFAPSGNFKSYTVATIAAGLKNKKQIFYFDFEYNPGGLKRHCEKLGITYLTPTTEYDEVKKLLDSRMDMSNTLFIFDSFSYLLEDGNNDATDTKEVVHEMRLLCKELGATVIYIDHATILDYTTAKKAEPDIAPTHQRWRYKVEGNESGKKKPCDLIYMVEPDDLNDHSQGVKIMCTKSRAEGRNRGDIVNATISEPEEAIYEMHSI